MEDGTGDSPTLASQLSGVAAEVAGRYRVRARLGRGATKEVYLAYDVRLDREVALAIVVGASSDAARARIVREAQVTGRLGDHPNVITVYDTGEHDGLPYLVLRAMTGGSLADLLDRERPSIARVIKLGGEIAAALAHAHAHDVVHRDVKPDNVWLAADGSAAVGDFGIAHLLGADRLTADGVVVGTVRYLSPEQIRGEEVGPSSDLYALGVTLYELVTGRPPFQAKDATQVLTQHLTSVPVPPSELEPAIPDELERLILTLLAKDPQLRPASADAVAATLAAIAASAPPDAPTRTRPVGATAQPREARRVVSVLAARADIADPEALHGVFDRCAEVIEQHGGTVERYLGDALVGFFGLEQSHGDDALRATRAAIALRSESAELRLGIESGEVFLAAGPRGAPVATGATITTAGRLAERAAQGEILLGDRIRPTVAPDATIDAETGRLDSLELERPALLRAPDTPFVGREVSWRSCATRSLRCARSGRAASSPSPGRRHRQVAARRRVPQRAGRRDDRPRRTLPGLRRRHDVPRARRSHPRSRAEPARPCRGAAGRRRAGGARHPLGGRALRRGSAGGGDLLGAAAPARAPGPRPPARGGGGGHPLGRAGAAGPARPRGDALDRLADPAAVPDASRAAGLASGLDRTARQPRGDGARRTGRHARQELARRLGAGDRAAQIAQRAEGNPLFVEQLVAVGGDAGQATSELPASIQGVLAARLDLLDHAERSLLQRASVEGRTFHAGALAAVLPEAERRRMRARFVALARKGLIGADQPQFDGEDAYRFTHALIREAAYAGLPKLVRADLHAALAEWLEARPRAADEIVGFHLEQACQLAAGLGRTGERELALRPRAIGRFRAASRAALTRGDPGAASALLERAIALPAFDDDARVELLPALGASLYEAGRLTEATRVLDEAVEHEPQDVRARIERELVRLEVDAGAGTERAHREADAALAVFRRTSDGYGEYRAWSLHAQAAWLAGRVGRADEAWVNAAECARRAGDARDLFDILGWRATAAVHGPTPVAEAIRRCEEFRRSVAASPVATMWIVNPLALLNAMTGDFELSEQLLAEADDTRRKLGSPDYSVSHLAASARLLAGRPDLAEEPLRRGVQKLAGMGDGRMLATTIALLAQAVYAQGGTEEAAELCRRAADGAPDDDIVTQVIWRSVQAKIAAREGRAEDGERLAREAVALIDSTDLLNYHGDAMLDLAEVLSITKRSDEARECLRAGLALYEAKGNTVAGARARSLLVTR